MEWPKLQFVIFVVAFTLVSILVPMAAWPLLTKIGAEIVAVVSAASMLSG